MRITDLNVSQPIKIARAVSLESTHTGHKLGAVIVRSGKIISKSYNQGNKTHTYVKRNGEHYNQTLHAELSCIFKVKNKDLLRGSTIFVYRERKNGELGNARPCPMCYELIKYYGIKRIVYSNDLGIVQEELLATLNGGLPSFRANSNRGARL